MLITFQMESEGVIDKIAGHAIKIYYVPVGESQENSVIILAAV